MSVTKKVPRERNWRKIMEEIFKAFQDIVKVEQGYMMIAGIENKKKRHKVYG